MKINYKLQNAFIVSIIVFLGISFNYNHINEYPSYTHAWAQTDRYALAQGFVNNNLNFFKPETFILNKQFPDTWRKPYKESITAVDFPIHDYIPAIVMKLTGHKSPWIFRLYTMLYSFIGLFYLYKLSYLLSNDFLKSILVILFAATSPMFVFYQAGFLPTIPSLANAIIGIYFYTTFFNTTQNKHFNLSILFLALATLSRTTFAIPLLSVLGLELLRIIKKDSTLKSKIIPVSIAITAIILFYFHNTQLREKHGSLFLNYLLPATSIQQAFEILQSIREEYIFRYFTITHYYLIGLIIVIAFLMMVKNTGFDKIKLTFFILIGFISTGFILFAIVMLRQFPHHDYYFLDTFYIPIVLLFALALSVIPIPKKANWVFAGLIIILSIPLTTNALNFQNKSYTTNNRDRLIRTVDCYKNSESLLDSLKIAKEAKILLLDGYVPNMPFLLMNRKGYTMMRRQKSDNIIAVNS